MKSNASRPFFIISISVLTLCSCVTTGSVRGGDISLEERVSNVEVNTANSTQTVEELKAAQEKIQGQLEKIERLMAQQEEKINKLTGDGALGQTQSQEQTAAGTGPAPLVEQEKQPYVDNMEQTPTEVVAKTTVPTPEAVMPVAKDADINSLSLDEKYKLAKKFHDQKKYDEAEKYYQTIVGVPSKWYDERARFLLGSVYYDMGKYKEAIVTLQDFIDKYPKSKSVPPAILIQGESFTVLKQNSNAEVFYKDLVARFPKSKEAVQAKSKLKKL